MTRSSARPRELAIVGAGISGCVLAQRMTRMGWSVSLFDPQPGSGGSGNPWALLHEPVGESLDARLLRLALQLALAQLDSLPLSPAAVLREGERIVAVAPSILLQVLLTTAGPGLLQQVPQSVQALQMDPDSGVWSLACADGPKRHFAHVVLANATAAAQLWPPLSALLQAVRGQVDEFALAAPLACAVPPVLRGAGGYALSLRPLHWLVGASFQTGRTDLDCDPADTQANRQRLGALLGASEQAVVADARHLGGRAALRAVTADRRPLIGAAPAARGGWMRDGWPVLEAGLWLNVGHGAHGFTLAFLAAEILAAALQPDSAPLPLALTPRELRALAPGRFARR